MSEELGKKGRQQKGSDGPSSLAYVLESVRRQRNFHVAHEGFTKRYLRLFTLIDLGINRDSSSAAHPAGI